MAHILDKTGVVISNRQLSDRLWIIDIKVDALGADLMPGQFVHMQRYHYLVSGCWFRQQASDNGQSRYGC